MSNFFGGSAAGRTNQPIVPAAALRIQSAVAGQPIAILHGQQRIAGNLIDYEGFNAAPQASPSGSGKGLGGGGGGKGSSGTQGYLYAVNVLLGLAEGPIDQVLGLWNNKTPQPLVDLNFTPFSGTIGQAVWPFMTASFPNVALSYSSLAYLGAGPIELGNSPELPNLNFELRGAIAAAVTEIATVPSSPWQVNASYFSLAAAVTEQITVPAVAPYTYSAVNPYATNSMPVVLGNINSGALPGSASQGAVYTETGDPLTRVTASPSTGQYSISSGGVYTFAAGDAGALVTLIDFAVSPGVNYAEQPTGNTSAGSAIVTSLSSTAGLAQGQLVTGPGIPVGTVLQSAIGAGSFTGTLTSGSKAVTNVSLGADLAVGAVLTDSAGALPADTSIAAAVLPAITLNVAQAATAPGDSITFQTTEIINGITSATGGTTLYDVSPTDQIAIGATVTGDNLQPGTTVTGIAGSTISLSLNVTLANQSETFVFSATVSADATAGLATLANPSSFAGLAVGMQAVSDTAGVVQGIITGLTLPSLTLSAAATANETGDTFSYPATVILSQAATATATGVTLTFLGAALTQVLNAAPAAGQFQVSAQAGSFGQYQFSSADAGRVVVITDVPDADPAASLTDFLSNPRYGCGFPLENIGDLSLLQDYAYAAGLFISPAIVSSQAANSYLNDFATGLNGEFVWSGGLLTFVPYGDTQISANGKTYIPPSLSGPIYSLGDDDYLPNEGTASIGVSAFTSDDPVVCVRKRQSDALNDVKLEYLDRGNSYNPAIVEAKDDAAINLFGLRPADTKQLHFFCIEAAALTSAQLQLGRQQIRNQYSFTAPWWTILLDPMDVIAITDAGIGLVAQLVRVIEITENQQDWSLTYTVEEVLDGTGTTPLYGTQPKAGFTPNYNADPGTAVAPVILEPPVQISTTGGLETWLLAGGAPGTYGGVDVYVSSDGETYRHAGRITGSNRIGVTTADFPSGGDPDTTDTLAVDLTAVGGQLLSGTQADADLGHTLCAVKGYAFAPAPTLSSLAGGSLAAQTYWARITYVFASGEGPPSPEESVAVAASFLLSAASPPAQAGATGWNLYAGATSGGETLQNASPIAIGTGWTESSGGLVTGTAPPPAETGFELVSYEAAVLTASGKYALQTYLRRGLYGSTISDHPAGSSFARLDGTQLVIPYDKSQIGNTIYFKLTPFNFWGGGEPGLSEVPAWSYTIEGPPAPQTVENFSAQASGGAVVFAWTDLTGDGFIAYDLLYGVQGGSVAGATFLTQAARGTEMTNAAVPPGAWTFYIRGHDTLSGRTGPASSVDLTVANVNTVIATASESPDWLGAKNGFLLHHTGMLVPDSPRLASQLSNAELFGTFVPYPVPNPTYTGAHSFDGGFNGNFRLWATWSASAGGNSANENAEIIFSADLWQTGQSDPDSFSPWGASADAVNERYVRYAIRESTVVPAFVSALTVTVDNPSDTYAVNGFVVAASGTTLTFASAAGVPAQFHAIPNVQVTAMSAGAVSGVATGISTSACTITLYDGSGAAVAGTANILITGP